MPDGGHHAVEERVAFPRDDEPAPEDEVARRIEGLLDRELAPAVVGPCLGVSRLARDEDAALDPGRPSCLEEAPCPILVRLPCRADGAEPRRPGAMDEEPGAFE